MIYQMNIRVKKKGLGGGYNGQMQTVSNTNEMHVLDRDGKTFCLTCGTFEF
jgi:hypothetical protein